MSGKKASFCGLRRITFLYYYSDVCDIMSRGQTVLSTISCIIMCLEVKHFFRGVPSLYRRSEVTNFHDASGFFMISCLSIRIFQAEPEKSFSTFWHPKTFGISASQREEFLRKMKLFQAFFITWRI